jgi:hypothetical protein
MHPGLPDMLVIEQAWVWDPVALSHTLQEQGNSAVRVRARRNIGSSDRDWKHVLRA